MEGQQSTSVMSKNMFKRAASFDFAEKPDHWQLLGAPFQRASSSPPQTERLQKATSAPQGKELLPKPASTPPLKEKCQAINMPQETVMRPAREKPARQSSKLTSRSSMSPTSYAPEQYKAVDDDDNESSMSDFADIMIGRHRRQSVLAQEETPGSEFWTTGVWFKNLVAGIIVANTVVLIIQASVIQMQLSIFTFLDCIFTVLYVCELASCIYEQGIKKYLCEDDWWNWFDMFVTVSCVVDLFVTATASNASITRLFRLSRILRMFRGLRFLSELDYVLIQIARATLKLAFLASIMLFVSSMVATSLLWDCDDSTVSGMFENLGKSLWTMFKIMTLDNWIATVDVVLEVKPEMIWFFVAFIFSTAISLISLAPAMFIDISLKQMEHKDFKERELARSQLRRKKKKILSTLFKLTDVDDSGSISVDELKTVLTNDSFIRELEKRGISQAEDIRDVRLGLFDIWEEHLNTTEGNQPDITMDEFTNGLLRIHEESSQAELWRSITSTRLLLREFAAVVLDEMAHLRSDMSSHFEHSVAGLSRSSAEGSHVLISPSTSPEASHSLHHRKDIHRKNSSQTFTRRSSLEKHLGLSDGSKGHGHEMAMPDEKEEKKANATGEDDVQFHEELIHTHTKRLSARLEDLILSRQLSPSPRLPSVDDASSGTEDSGLESEEHELSSLLPRSRVASDVEQNSQGCEPLNQTRSTTWV